MTNNFNLFINKIGKIEINLNENLKQIYLKYIDKIITELFEEINDNSLIIEKEFDESNEILNFIKNPSKAVYNFIRKSIEQKINENEVKYNLIQSFEKIINFLKNKISCKRDYPLKEQCKSCIEELCESIINESIEIKKKEKEQTLIKERETNLEKIGKKIKRISK